MGYPYAVRAAMQVSLKRIVEIVVVGSVMTA
jgi:hypothetical protein